MTFSETPAEEKTETAESVLTDVAALAEDGSRYFTVHADQVEADVENPVSEEEEDSEPVPVEDAVALQEQLSTIRYSNVMQGTDLEYTNYGYDLKESILIQEPKASYYCSFLLDLSDLTPEMNKDGSIELNDADGRSVFEIPAPWLEDANGVVSEQASYDLTKTDVGYVLTVTADPTWMNAEERAFPNGSMPPVSWHQRKTM